MPKQWLCAILLTASCLACAAEIQGVRLADNSILEDVPLTLNGVGVRSKLWIKVYVGGLYLPERQNNAAAIIASNQAKRVELHLLRGMSAEQLAGALDEGLSANNSASELKALENEIQQFRALLVSASAVKEGDIIQLDYAPLARGTRLVRNGKTLGSIAGEQFNRALLKVWLGEHPVDASLKKALLGL